MEFMLKGQLLPIILSNIKPILKAFDYQSFIEDVSV